LVFRGRLTEPGDSAITTVAWRTSGEHEIISLISFNQKTFGFLFVLMLTLT
jgi:hypothetical protein